MRNVLSIGGSDPTSGAGIQADIKVFHSIGVYGLSVITAVTSQNTTGVRDVTPIPPGVVRSQLYTLTEDIPLHAVKTGMLCSSEIVEVVSAFVREQGIRDLVVDPVHISTSGQMLTDSVAMEKIVSNLLPLSRVVTPNVNEASYLSGVSITDHDSLYRAARRIRSLGADVVIITGGHFYKEGMEGLSVDYYYDGEELQEISSRRYDGEFHGTGCVYSAALTAYLSLSGSVLESARRARLFMDKAFQSALSPGRGMAVLGV